jgi:hypothetical protein
MLQISTGGMSLPCHEIGCPNTHKVWNEEDQEWVTPEPEANDDYWEPEEEDDDDDFEYQDEDRGGTGHGDISYSDADPGL